MARIGDFDIIRLAGRGAYATVWEGRHASQGYTVAIKIPHHIPEQKARRDATFLSEIRMVARLKHPGIIRVFDYGRLIHPITIDAHHTFQVGAVYLVMEWIDGGTLDDVQPQLRWGSLRDALLLLLDTLAAAHARGVIHRDLKPENILISDRGPILTDFGVALFAETDGDGSQPARVAGTPSYMAPEQIRGQLHACGPWTDLYALGCMVYRLVSGCRPFTGATFSHVARAHLYDSPPPLEPLFPVPDGLEKWIKKLLRKSIDTRYQLAADAALGLVNLCDDVSAVLRAERGDVSPEDETVRDTLVGSTLMALPLFHSTNDALPAVRKATTDLPKISETWHSPHDGRTNEALQGMGRTLFTWTHGDFIGRSSERDYLWNALRETIAESRCRCIGLFGEAGLGKTALAQWLGERAHATGAALPHLMTHEAPNGPRCGVNGFLERCLRVSGLATKQRSKRLQAFCAQNGLEEEQAVFEAIVAPSGHDAGTLSAPNVFTPNERFEAVARLLKVYTDARPRVLIIDDLQWASHAVNFIEYLFRRWSHLPILIVCTIRRDLIHARSASQRLFADPETGPSPIERLDLGPLPRDVQREMVTGRIRLDPATLSHVLDRSQGNPLFLEASIRHWIESGILVDGGRGYRVSHTSDGGLPSDIRALWQARVASVVEVGSEGWVSMEVAAALGRRVQVAEWQAVCLRHGIHGRLNLVEHLIEHQLLEAQNEIEWEFRHVLLRDFLLEHASQANRLAPIHLACAQTIEEASPQSAERVGGHFLDAMHYERGLPFLRQAILAAFERSDYPSMRRIALRYAYGLRRLKTLRESRAWLWLRNVWNYYNRVSGALVKAAYHAKRGISIAEKLGDRNALYNYLLEAGMGEYNTGEVRAALPYLARAKQLGAADQNVQKIVLAGLPLARLYSNINRVVEAQDLLLDLEKRTRGIEYLQDERVEIFLAMARGAVEAGNLDDARLYLARAKSSAQHGVNGYVKAAMMSQSGNLALAERRLDDAEECFRQAGRLLRRLGNIDVWEAEIELAYVEGARGDWQAMYDVLMTALATAERLDWTQNVRITELTSLTPLMYLRRWTEVDAILAKYDGRSLPVVPRDALFEIQGATEGLAALNMPVREEKMWMLLSQLFRKAGLIEAAQSARERCRFS